MGYVASEDLKMEFWKGKGRANLLWEIQILCVAIPLDVSWMEGPSQSQQRDERDPVVSHTGTQPSVGSASPLPSAKALVLGRGLGLAPL